MLGADACKATRGTSMALGLMNAEYRFRFDEAFVVESLKRFRSRHSARALRWALKSVGFIGLAALAAVGVFARSRAMTGLFAFFILLLAAAPLFDIWWLKRRFRKSPFYNSDVVVRFSDTGYVGEEQNSRTELAWPVFTEGYRLSDGILLFTGPTQFHWFPDRALVHGELSELSSAMKTKISRFRGAEQTVAADRPKTGSG